MDRLAFTSNATIAEQAVVRQSLVNELANVSTVGFKRSFEIATRSIKVEGEGFETRYQTQAVPEDRIRLDPGPIMATGRPLDIAMSAEAVLGVQAENGELAFTRRGDLRTNAQGVLETGSGQVVLGEGGPINIPAGFYARINPDGSVYATDPAQVGPGADVLIDQLLLRDASQTKLLRRMDGLFAPEKLPLGSDFATGPQMPVLIPQALEGSNVSAVHAMTRLIDHSRTFEAQIRVIKEAKSLDETGASMMRNA